MSISYSTYLGPCIICVPKQVLTKFYKEKICIHCKRFNDIINQAEVNKFCPDCGNKLFDITYQIITENSTFEVTEKLEEKLYAARNDNIKEHIYLSNINLDDEPRNFKCDLSDFGQNDMLVLDSGTIENEKLWFIGKFRQEIEWLKNYYGADNVKVEFLFFTEVY